MSDNISKKLASKYASLAFFTSLFLFFTPFEQGGSNPTMFPKYFVAGMSIILLVPLIAFQKIKLRAPSMLALVALLTIIFHTIAVKPVPAQFMLLIAANLVLAVVLYETSFSWSKEFESAVCWLLTLHAAIITVQALLFYIFAHGIFDFHKLIFGSDSRFAEDFLNIARFSGMQVEPGTYANYIGCLLGILLLSSAFNEKILWMSFLFVISIFLTNSGSSFYFVPVLIALLAYLWRKKIRLSHVLILCIAIFAYMHFSGVVTHLEDRFLQRDDGSLSHRMEGVHAYMSTTLEEKFFGIGFGDDPCVRCYYQDIGVTFNLLTRGGIIVTLAFGLLWLRSIAVNGLVLSVILFLIPLNEKMFFYEAPIWLFILFAATGSKQLRAAKMPRDAPARPQLAKAGL
jgi:hypothetical protein